MQVKPAQEVWLATHPLDKEDRTHLQVKPAQEVWLFRQSGGLAGHFIQQSGAGGATSAGVGTTTRGEKMGACLASSRLLFCMAAGFITLRRLIGRLPIIVYGRRGYS